ncbi:hypothetical protein [Micromonospora chersina]|uniref:hypothetical protein n=1 Tax=Micromonospora chersina TaxID=47854 RepID=UPI003D8D5ED1
MSQGSPARSPLRRTIAASGALAYWPVEDGRVAGQAASAVAGHPPLAVTGTVSFRPVDDYVDLGYTVRFGTSALADLSAGGRLSGPVPGEATAATAGAWTVHVAAGGLDPANTAGDVTLLEWTTPGGTFVRWRLVAQKALSSTQVIGYNATGGATTLIDHVGLAFGFAEYAVSAYQVGGSFTVKLYLGDYDPVFETYSGAGTVAGVSSVAANATGTTSTAQMPFGHVAIFATQAPPFDLAGRADASNVLVNAAWASYEGETALGRLARLCAEDGVQLTVPAVPDYATTRMGAQPAGTPLDLYRQCEAADQGVLYELGFGLGYLPRHYRYNRSTALTLDYAAGQVAPSFEPVDDDHLLRNRVTVRRVDGSEATAEDPASIAAAGPYEQSVDVNLASDDDLLNHAAWRVHLAAVTQWAPDELAWVAHHEACHAVAAVALGVLVDWADLEAGEGYGGTQWACADPHTDAVVSLAGWMGSGGHLQGPPSTHDTQQAIELVGRDGIPAAMRDAAAILASREADIAAVAAALREHGWLTGEQITAIVGSDDRAGERVHTAAVAELTPALRRRLAHHEASHAVVAVHLGAPVAWVAVTMRPAEVADAGLPALPEGHQYGGTMVREVDPHTDAVIALAGWVADLGHIFGPQHTHDTQAALELVGAAGFPAAVREAEAILAARSDAVAYVREALIRHDRITGDQLAAIVQAHP